VSRLVEDGAADAWVVPVGPDTVSETDVDRDRFGDSGVGVWEVKSPYHEACTPAVLRPGATSALRHDCMT